MEKTNSQNRTFFPFYQVINPLVHFSVCLKDVVKCCPKSAGDQAQTIDNGF